MSVNTKNKEINSSVRTTTAPSGHNLWTRTACSGPKSGTRPFRIGPDSGPDLNRFIQHPLLNRKLQWACFRGIRFFTFILFGLAHQSNQILVSLWSRVARTWAQGAMTHSFAPNSAAWTGRVRSETIQSRVELKTSTQDCISIEKCTNTKCGWSVRRGPHSLITESSIFLLVLTLLFYGQLTAWPNSYVAAQSWPCASSAPMAQA